MKKLLIAILLVIPFLLMSCQIWGEDSYVGGQTCDRYDQALDVGFATTSTVDSVQFFMNGIQVCMPHDYELFRENRGDEGFQGRFDNVRDGDGICIKNCYSSKDSSVNMKILSCIIGQYCDEFNYELSDVLIAVYSSNRIDTIQIKGGELAPVNYNMAYKIFPKSDSLLMYYLEEDYFTYKGCQGEYCFAERPHESLLCVDSHSDYQKFKNICEEETFFRY